MGNTYLWEVCVICERICREEFPADGADILRAGDDAKTGERVLVLFDSRFFYSVSLLYSHFMMRRINVR